MKSLKGLRIGLRINPLLSKEGAGGGCRNKIVILLYCWVIEAVLGNTVIECLNVKMLRY